MKISLVLASSISNIANIGLLLSLVGGVISSGLIAWTANLKEHYWDRDRTDSATRIAVLDTEVARANERAAQANQTAEQERLARLKIEERLANRTISDAQVVKLADAMRQFHLIASGEQRTAAVFSYPERTYESEGLAQSLLGAFQKADWYPNPNTVTYGLAIPAFTGIAVLTARSPLAIGIGEILVEKLNDFHLNAHLLTPLYIGQIDGSAEERARADDAAALSVMIGNKN